jgi:hypothetical protein
VCANNSIRIVIAIVAFIENAIQTDATKGKKPLGFGMYRYGLTLETSVSIPTNILSSIWRPL